MRVHTILILIIYFSSCKQNKPTATFFKTQNFIVADTTVKANEFLQFYEYNCDFPIYYIGAKVDTIKIGKRYCKERAQWTNNFKTPWSKKYSNKMLTIFVDTAIKNNSLVEYYSYNPNKAYNSSTLNYNAFLFSIKNISNSTVYLGHSFSIYFISREAKNKNCITIDKKLSELGICCTGQPTITLKSNELVISKVKRYRGSFVTDFRLAFGYGNNVVYSNAFRDFIDERTLQNI